MADSIPPPPRLYAAALAHAKHGLWMQTPSVVYFPVCRGCGKVAIVIHGFGCKRFTTSRGSLCHGLTRPCHAAPGLAFLITGENCLTVGARRVILRL
jgi:hypothetical protein